MSMLSVQVKSNIDQWMSAGFNIYGAYDLATSALQRRIFDPSKARKVDSDIGPLPEYLSYRPLPDSNFFNASGDGRESFQSRFAARATVDTSIGAFTGHIEATFGQQVAESSQYSFANLSFRDMHGNLVLDRLGDTQFLSQEFVNALAALPDRAEPANLDQFFDFFQRFGAYFVTQITLGGTLEYSVAVQQSTSLRATEIAAKVQAEYNSLFFSGKATAEMSSDQRWQSYRSHKTTNLRVKGGGDVERALLNQVDTHSLDGMTPATVAAYNKWLGTIASHPAVMNFQLTGIWEVCGAKSRTVEDAFRQFGRMMRPLLHIETRTVVPPGDTYTPGVFLGGHLISSEPSHEPYHGFGGYRLVVIDRRHPGPDGVRLSRLYNLSSGDGSQYRQVFETMRGDLQHGGFLDNNYFLVLATFGMYNAYPPVPDFVRLLQEGGAGAQLDRWIADAAAGAGTSHITGAVNYVLVGIMKSGPSAGVELLSLERNFQPHTSTLDVYFYGLGAGQRYVLGSFESKP